MTKKTSDKILLAALELMQDRGFKAITVKEIAEVAGVSEMTVFRHFETKMGVLEAAIQKYSYIPYFETLFEEQIVWDLEQDLMAVAKSYLTLMEQNKPIFLIAITERSTMPELSELISQNTLQLNGLLADYFTQMMKKELIIEFDAKMHAMLFLTTLFGYFVSTATWEDHYLQSWRDAFIEATVKNFVRGVRK